MRFEFCLGPPFTSYKINGCALNATAVKLVFKELQNKEQIDFKKLFTDSHRLELLE